MDKTSILICTIFITVGAGLIVFALLNEFYRWYQGNRGKWLMLDKLYVGAALPLIGIAILRITGIV